MLIIDGDLLSFKIPCIARRRTGLFQRIGSIAQSIENCYSSSAGCDSTHHITVRLLQSKDGSSQIGTQIILFQNRDPAFCLNVCDGCSPGLVLCRGFCKVAPLLVFHGGRLLFCQRLCDSIFDTRGEIVCRISFQCNTLTCHALDGTICIPVFGVNSKLLVSSQDISNFPILILVSSGVTQVILQIFLDHQGSRGSDRQGNRTFRLI